MNKKKVVIAGATGSLGSKIVKELLSQGAEVTAMVRATSNRDKLEKMGVTNFVIGDMVDKESLRRALTPENKFDAIMKILTNSTDESALDKSFNGWCRGD